MRVLSSPPPSSITILSEYRTPPFAANITGWKYEQTHNEQTHMNRLTKDHNFEAIVKLSRTILYSENLSYEASETF